jgi:hypothetical protein
MIGLPYKQWGTFLCPNVFKCQLLFVPLLCNCFKQWGPSRLQHVPTFKNYKAGWSPPSTRRVCLGPVSVITTNNTKIGIINDIHKHFPNIIVFINKIN